MSLDLSVNLGNILTIISFLVGGAFFIAMIKSSIGIIDMRLIALEKSNDNQNVEIKKLADILVTLGKYEERFLRLEGQLDDIRHGRGLIK